MADAHVEVRAHCDGELVGSTVLSAHRPVLVGRAAGSDLYLPMLEVPQVLLWLDNSQVWIRALGGSDGVSLYDHPISNVGMCLVEQAVQLGAGVSLEVHRLTPTHDGLPYCVEVVLNHALGAQTHVHNLSSGVSCMVSSSNTASLAYLLGRRLLQDMSSELPVDEWGWCSSVDLSMGIWGRRWLEMADSTLDVLIFRSRKRLVSAGLNPQCIERKRGFVRLWVQKVLIPRDARAHA